MTPPTPDRSERTPEKPWDFDRWFKAQHGPRPVSMSAELLIDRVKSLRIMLANDERDLAALESWEARRTSALYAWQIKDTEKR